MVDVKGIIVRPVKSNIANRFIRENHYSGKVVSNSQLHFGAFYNDILHGVLSFGPSLDKSKIIGLVSGTGWNEFLELNRMAFDDYLPKNSESRCISVSLKMIKKHYPHIKWIISFADGTQCGDGTIYRASGFVLTGIKENSDCMLTPMGVVHTMTIKSSKKLMGKYGDWKKAMVGEYGEYEPLKGYQLRYMYFIDRSAKDRLSVPIIPFSRIKELGASMYKGKKCADSSKLEQPAFQQEEGGAVPTSALHFIGNQ